MCPSILHSHPSTELKKNALQNDTDFDEIRKVGELLTEAQIDSSQDRSRFVPVHDLRRSGKHLDHAIRQQTVWGFHFRRDIRPFDILDRNQIPITDKQSSSLTSQ